MKKVYTLRYFINNFDGEMGYGKVFGSYYNAAKFLMNQGYVFCGGDSWVTDDNKMCRVWIVETEVE